MADSAKKAVKRIREMEAALEDCTAAFSALDGALRRADAQKETMCALFRYYGSGDWHADRELYESGALPEDLKCGVLGEDLPYDAITDARAAALDMLSLATDILKNL